MCVGCSSWFHVPEMAVPNSAGAPDTHVVGCSSSVKLIFIDVLASGNILCITVHNCSTARSLLRLFGRSAAHVRTVLFKQRRSNACSLSRPPSFGIAAAFLCNVEQLLLAAKFQTDLVAGRPLPLVRHGRFSNLISGCPAPVRRVDQKATLNRKSPPVHNPCP